MILNKRFLWGLLCLFLLGLSANGEGRDPRSTYQEAREYLKANKWQEAIPLLESLEKDYPLLADYILFDRASCYERLGDLAGAVDCFKKIVVTYKNSPLYRKSFLKLLELKTRLEGEAALQDYELYLAEFPNDEPILMSKAELLVKLGREREAEVLWQKLFVSGGNYAFRAYNQLKKVKMPSYEEIKAVAKRLKERELYELIVKFFTETPPIDEEGKYLLGLAYYHLRRYKEALLQFSFLSNPEGRYHYALCLMRIGEREAFYRYVGSLSKDKKFYPLFLLMVRMKGRDGNYGEAKDLLAQLLVRYPEKREEIQWYQAWFALREGDFPRAERILSLLLEGNPHERDKYLFWLGKVKSYQGKEAKECYLRLQGKYDFYWFRAGREAPLPLTEVDAPPFDREAQPLPPEWERLFKRVYDLHWLKMSSEARQEARLMRNILPETYLSNYLKLLYYIEDYWTLVRLGMKYDRPSLKYPLAFWDVVLGYAQKEKIDPLLVVAIMREESRFQRDALSRAKAHGLMQLIVDTAKRLGGIRDREELFEVDKNIKIGVRYLSSLLKKFKSIPYAVSAYNAGEKNVERWLARGYRDEDEFIEGIPFEETKGYVIRVIKTYEIMKGLYGNRIAQKEGR